MAKKNHDADPAAKTDEKPLKTEEIRLPAPTPPLPGAMPKPSAGRVLHLNLGTLETPEWRPATVTRCNGGGETVNLVVTLDGPNDREAADRFRRSGTLEVAGLSAWASSVAQGDGPLCWRWPPRE